MQRFARSKFSTKAKLLFKSLKENLLKICDCEIHFANYANGDKQPLPIFGGQKGPEITRSLLEISSTFDRHLNELRKVKHTILDVKATTWHEDYNK
jgi:dynein heavy chain